MRELEARGVRITQQRRLIVGIIQDSPRHLDAATLLELARKQDSTVDRSTVYRTIAMLKDRGLIDELDLLHLRGHRHYYESHGPRDHIHVACIRCGKVREIESELYEELKKQISKDCDIEISISRTEVGGICGDCRAKS